MKCGKPTPDHLIDAKPFKGATEADIAEALEANADFEWLECGPCYGPGFVAADATPSTEGRKGEGD
jgi:hypothetical protein